MGLDGEATLQDLEKEVEPILASRIKVGDSLASAGGIERWKVMIRRARKPMIKEGFIESGSGKIWKITIEGQRAADQKSQAARPAGPLLS